MTDRIITVNPENCIRIPAGIYPIGLDESSISALDPALFSGTVKREYLTNAMPRHEVPLAETFISRRLVTLNEFRAFIEDSGYLTEAEAEGWGWSWLNGGWIKREGVGWRAPFGEKADELYKAHGDIMPVLQVSWNDAAAFCAWLSEQSGMAVRLPREAEWEAFAEMRGVRPLAEISAAESAKAQKCFRSFALSDYAVRILKRVRALSGECDPGLVWEWCEDWFDAYPDGTPNREFGTTYKVLRGGSLQSLPVQKAREYRFRRCPTARSPFYGFRAAISRLTPGNRQKVESHQ